MLWCILTSSQKQIRIQDVWTVSIYKGFNTATIYSTVQCTQNHFEWIPDCEILTSKRQILDIVTIINGYGHNPHQHTSYLSRTHGRCPCKFFLAGVNFYRFNAKNWHFRQILREKVAFFTDLTRKIGVFRCKFYSPKILPV